MMAGKEDDIEGLELCSHQDEVETGGTKFDYNENDIVCDDLGASYVFVSSVGEDNVVVLVSEVRESEESDMIGLQDVECELGEVEDEVGDEEAQKGTEVVVLPADSDEGQEGVITLADLGEYDQSIKDVEHDLVVPSADFAEGDQPDTVALGNDICKMEEIQAIEVDVGEGKSEDQTELNSVEETLESEFRITKSVDCVPHDLEESQYKFELVTALDSEIDGGVQIGDEIGAVADKGIICRAAADDLKDLDICIDESQSVDKLDMALSNVATPYSIDKVPIECSENITAGTDDCAAAENEESHSVVVQAIGKVDSTELDSNLNQTYAQLAGHVPAKISESIIPSIDTYVTLTTEAATRSVTDESNIAQINLGEQRNGCTKSETEVASGLSSCVPNDVMSDIKIEFGTIDSTEVVAKYWDCNSLFQSQVLNDEIDCNRKQANVKANFVESEGCADMSLKSDGQNHSAINRSDMHDKDAIVAECFTCDSVDGQSQGTVAKAKPFQFLVKFPRIDDDKLREQIRDVQLLVEEKTDTRNKIRCEIDIKRANLQSLRDEFEATKSDERAARRLVKLKRQEIDSVQDKINRIKNSVSVIDITNRIALMEHMIEHETHSLKEEMRLLREIKVIKKLRSQISSNVCSEEEVTQGFSQLKPTEMQLKTLRKELGDLKDKVSKSEAADILLGKEYNEESKKLRELQAQFRDANDIRQDAYKDLVDLKRQLHEKSKHFWIYKDDLKAASNYALNGDKEALYHHSAKQVDTFMDLWNKNDEFREDYVRCNMKSTLRRFKTLDGRSLGPDEEAHVPPVYVSESESRQLNNPSSPTILKQEITVQPVEREPKDGKSLVMAEPKSIMLKSKTSVDPIPEIEGKEQQSKEEIELASKDEMLTKEEIEAKLKEQLRQEEKLKAQEALERKKRNADKAQMRAVLRAQKEAEQKEKKEKEKRLRKKEKKTTDGDNGLEPLTNHINDEGKDSPPTKRSKTSHFNKSNKTKATIPPALRSRGKRRLKQFMWWIFGAVIVLFMFLVGNGGAFKNLQS